MKKNYREWTVKIRVDESWVHDGFRLLEGTLHNVISEMLPYAYPEEIEVEIIKEPHPLYKEKA